MISKFINWNSKISKYMSKMELERLQPGYKAIGILNNDSKSYWDYFLNYLTEDRVNPQVGEPIATPYEAQFVALKSFKKQYTDDPVDAGSLTAQSRLNLLNPSIVKTATFPQYVEASGTYRYRSGVRIQIKADTIGDPTRLRHFNALVFQLNKLDKSYMDSLTARELRFVFEYTKKTSDANSQTATNAQTYRIVWDKNIFTPAVTTFTESITVSGNVSSTAVTQFRTNFFKIEDGIFLVDYEMLKLLGFDKDGLFYKEFTNGASVEERQYSFNFYIEDSSSDGPVLELANITMTNSAEVYLDNIKFGRKNLTTFNMNKKTGVKFPEINEYTKSLDSSIKFLYLRELLPLDVNFVKNNMNKPFYFFPYCHSTEGLSNAESLTSLIGLQYQAENQEFGGLYQWDTAFDITNSDYNLFDIPIKLDEYK